MLFVLSYGKPVAVYKSFSKHILGHYGMETFPVSPSLAQEARRKRNFVHIMNIEKNNRAA